MTEIKNLRKIANRLKKAIKNKERIVLYGDADLDGISSVIIAKESIKSLGGQVAEVYFPDREKEGYGLTESGLDYLKKWSPALLVLFDCGISNFKEVELANSMGFEVVIVDHHKVLDKLPKASIIVDPKQKGDKYPFKDFATGGLAYKLAEAVLGKKFSGALRKSFLELAAMATIADMMPQEHDNQDIIEQGLSSLETSFRPGIQALLEAELNSAQLDLRQKIPRLISILNIRENGQGLPSAFRLLTNTNFEECQGMVSRFLQENQIKKERIKEITMQVREIAATQAEQPLIFAGSKEWELIMLGVVASIISEQYQKPVFLYKESENESQGSVRAHPPLGIDTVVLMEKCREYLISFGGHAPASGFRLKNENLEKFKDCLIKNL